LTYKPHTLKKIFTPWRRPRIKATTCWSNN